MSRDEKYGNRDLTYSKWHRRLDDFLDWIDIDCCEYCHNPKCREPLALIELAQDVGQSFKATTVMRKLALKATLPAFLVFYKKGDDFTLITRFRVKQVSPAWSDEIMMSPDDYADFLRKIHLKHRCNNNN